MLCAHPDIISIIIIIISSSITVIIFSTTITAIIIIIVTRSFMQLPPPSVDVTTSLILTVLPIGLAMPTAKRSPSGAQAAQSAAPWFVRANVCESPVLKAQSLSEGITSKSRRDGATTRKTTVPALLLLELYV